MARDPRFPDEVEFVLGPDDVESVDEELPQRPRRTSRWGSGRHAGLLVAVVLAAAVVAVVAVGRSGSTPSAHASTTPSAPATSAGPGRSLPQLSDSPVTGSRIAVRHDRTSVVLIMGSTSYTIQIPARPAPGPACRTARVCRTTAVVSSGVLRALRARFGVVTVDSSTSVLTGSSATRLRLRTRTVLAHTGAQTIAIAVAPIQAGDSNEVTSGNAGSGVSVTVIDAQRPWTVTVTVRNLRTRDADTTTPAVLAADPRLLAVD